MYITHVHVYNTQCTLQEVGEEGKKLLIQLLVTSCKTGSDDNKRQKSDRELIKSEMHAICA